MKAKTEQSFDKKIDDMIRQAAQQDAQMPDEDDKCGECDGCIVDDLDELYSAQLSELQGDEDMDYVVRQLVTMVMVLAKHSGHHDTSRTAHDFWLSL